jgi:hypothetical protein
VFFIKISIRFIKHLHTHNIQYDESIHGYREQEDLNDYLKSCKKKRVQQRQADSMVMETAQQEGVNETASCSYLNL